MRSTRKVRVVGAAAVAAVALAMAACGSSSDSSGSTPSTSASSAAPMASSSGSTMTEAQFGSGCAAVPTDPSNPGSFDAMAKVPVATAASGNPVLSTLVTAVKQAGLVDSLNSAQNITVFAPTNDAFAKIPKADLDKVLADKAQLTKILTYHVVPEKLTPDQLAGAHKTLEGADVTVAGSGTSFKADGDSSVVCGNVQTANATVYIVDTVLMPTS
jgi:uncharacterized surface protein with fasciclin (FAS1) repeats